MSDKGHYQCAGVDTREGAGEAFTAERIGQPLSREKSFNPRAEALDRRAIASAIPLGVVTDLACAEALCTGTGRSRVWPGDGHRRSNRARRCPCTPGYFRSR